MKLLNQDHSQPRRGRTLITTIIAAVFVYLLWNITALSPLMYPFRLFVTYSHEAGHSLMALITGGKVLGFTVSPDGSGLATTAGGTRALILPAGYLGAAFFGAALFYILNTRPYARTISVLLGIGLMGFTVVYARPDDSGQITAILVGLLSGLGLAMLGWKLGRELNLLVLNILAIMTGLNAVFDVFRLVQYADVVSVSQNGIVRNDAAAFSNEIMSFVPASIVAFTWALLAALMMTLAVYYSILRPFLHSASNKSTPEQKQTSDAIKRDEDGEIDFSQFA